MYVGARMAALEEKRLMTERGGKLDSDLRLDSTLWPFLTTQIWPVLTGSTYDWMMILDSIGYTFVLGRLAVLKKKREIIAMKKLSRLMQDQRFGWVIYQPEVKIKPEVPINLCFSDHAGQEPEGLPVAFNDDDGDGGVGGGSDGPKSRFKGQKV